MPNRRQVVKIEDIPTFGPVDESYRAKQVNIEESLKVLLDIIRSERIIGSER